MITLFANLKGLLKAREFCTDSFVFRLHSRWTVLILLCCSILLSCRQHFGDPIHCLQRDVARIKALENFCWIHGTYILPHAWNGTVGVHIPHPGIDSYVRGQNKVYHGYYQWVAIVLFLQGVLFYLPRYLWRCWESGVIRALSLNLHDPLLRDSERDKSVNLLSHSLHLHMGHFGAYFKKYIFCEILTLANVVGQMWILDNFLGGTFTTFGIKVMQWSQWDQEYRTDPLVKAFPRMTKCLFHDYGSSGDVQRVDALCILPLNVLNEKIFIFLWFWMLFLCGMTVLVLAYRLMLAAMPLFRYCVLVTRAPHASKGALDRLVGRSQLSDWFILYLLSKNLDASNYGFVISKLAAEMEQNGYMKPSTSKHTTFV
ncbi:innexin inx2 [Parasteatoda tepidariorum]|uniref:innexin inx2 n=1 Tax=Parasteatoda tepidariorum TaxID=114398 RepID=UPI00077FBC25|nr:innexin inx2 [Parasteatoda tepidariorum]